MTRRSFQQGRQQRSKVVLAMCSGLLILLAAVFPAQAQQIQVTIGTASGAPGGTADVTVTLTDPAGTAVGAGLFVTFPAGTLGALSIDAKNDCVIASRLGTTHILAANALNLPPGGQGFDLEIAVNPLAPGSPNLPIGTGDLATCAFHIPDTAQLGTSVTLTAGSVVVSDANAQPLAASGVNGEVAIAPAVPGTNTPTHTIGGNTPTPTPPVPPTSTKTVPVNTPTDTPTSPPPPTKTKTQGPTPTNTGSAALHTGGGGGGCNIMAEESGPASPCLWLVIPAALLMWRRRSSR
jgi:hypothetical protein